MTPAYNFQSRTVQYVHAFVCDRAAKLSAIGLGSACGFAGNRFASGFGDFACLSISAPAAGRCPRIVVDSWVYSAPRMCTKKRNRFNALILMQKAREGRGSACD
jgi:hypothetical protein